MQQRVTVQEGAAGVAVRNYRSAAAYQVDAGPMATAGWMPVSQVETTGKIPPASALLAAIGVVAAFFVSLIAGAAIVVIAILIGIASRRHGMVVTYRRTPSGL